MVPIWVLAFFGMKHRESCQMVHFSYNRHMCLKNWAGWKCSSTHPKCHSKTLESTKITCLNFWISFQFPHFTLCLKGKSMFWNPKAYKIFDSISNKSKYSMTWIHKFIWNFSHKMVVLQVHSMPFIYLVFPLKFNSHTQQFHVFLLKQTNKQQSRCVCHQHNFTT